MFFPFQVADSFSGVRHRLSSTRLAELSLAPRQIGWDPGRAMRDQPDPVWSKSLSNAPAETVAAVTWSLEDLMLATDNLLPPSPEKLPDSRMREHLSALVRLWSVMGDALPEGLGAVRHVLSLPHGAFLDRLPVVEGSLDPLTPAVFRALYKRLETEFGSVSVGEKTPRAPDATCFNLLQDGLSQRELTPRGPDGTLSFYGLRDIDVCASFAAAKARSLIEAGCLACDIAVMTATEPRHLARAFARQGIPLSGLPSALPERDAVGETLLHLLLAKRSPAPAMVVASLCLSPLMPWDAQTGRDLAEAVMKGRTDSQIERSFPLHAEFLKALQKPAVSLSQLRLLMDRICEGLTDGRVTRARMAGLLEGEGSPDWEVIIKAVQIETPAVGQPERNIEGVSVWKADESPWRPCRNLIVADFSEGLYPARPRSNPLFLDSEIARIRDLTGLQLRGGAENLARGMQLFEEQLRAASGTVTFLVPRRDLGGARIAPSTSLALIARMIRGVDDAADLIVDISRSDPESWPVGHHIAEPNPPVHPVPEALEFGTRKLLALRRDDAGVALPQSPSRLETLLVSPLAWLLEEIGAEDLSWSAEELDVLTAGNIAHHVFEHVFVKDKDPPEGDILTGLLEDAYERAIARYAPFLRSHLWEMERAGLARDILKAATGWKDFLRRLRARVVANEMPLKGFAHGIALRGKADTMLVLPDGGLLLVDHKKSGTSGRRKRMEAGWDLQAGLYRDMIANPVHEPGDGMEALAGKHVGLAYHLMNDSGFLTSGVILPQDVYAEDMGDSVNDAAVERLRERLDQLREGRILLNTSSDEKFFRNEAGITPYALIDGSPLVTAFMREV